MIHCKCIAFLFLSLLLYLNDTGLAECTSITLLPDKANDLFASQDGITSVGDSISIGGSTRNLKRKKKYTVNKVKKSKKKPRQKGKKLRSHKLVAAKEKYTVKDTSDDFLPIAEERKVEDENDGSSDVNDITYNDEANEGSVSTGKFDDSKGEVNDASMNEGDESSGSSSTEGEKSSSGDTSDSVTDNISSTEDNASDIDLSQSKTSSTISTSETVDEKDELIETFGESVKMFKANNKYWDPELLEPEVVINDWFAILDGKKFRTLENSRHKIPYVSDEEFKYNVEYVKNKALTSPDLYNYYTSGARYNGIDDEDDNKKYNIPLYLEVGESNYVNSIRASISSIRSTNGYSGVKSPNNSLLSEENTLDESNLHLEDKENITVESSTSLDEQDDRVSQHSDDIGKGERIGDRRDGMDEGHDERYSSKSTGGSSRSDTASDGNSSGYLQGSRGQAVGQTLSDDTNSNDKGTQTDFDSDNEGIKSKTTSHDTSSSEGGFNEASGSDEGMSSGASSEETLSNESSTSFNSSSSSSLVQKTVADEEGIGSSLDDDNLKSSSTSSDATVETNEADSSSIDSTKSSNDVSTSSSDTGAELEDDVPPPLPSTPPPSLTQDERRRRFLQSMLDEDDTVLKKYVQKDVNDLDEVECKKELKLLRRKLKALQEVKE